MSFPGFDCSVPPGGYRWWYIDAISDDGDRALTLIAFIGSVFSPYYKHARKRVPVLAEDYCALNIALYGPGGRWCMTERDRQSLQRTSTTLTIGPSQLQWDSGQLNCTLNEWAFPFPRRVQGRLSISVEPNDQAPLSLHVSAAHHWQPIAPCTAIQVNFDAPLWRWRGAAYVDSNWGNSPLEQDFRHWQWSRAHVSDGSALIQYDIHNRHGQTQQHTLHFGNNRSSDNLRPEQQYCMPGTRYWQIARSTRLCAGSSIARLQTLEDTPFYARSRFDTRMNGLHARCIHESLDLDRFNKRWVRCLLPFRMPRCTHLVDIDEPVASGNRLAGSDSRRALTD